MSSSDKITNKTPSSMSRGSIATSGKQPGSPRDSVASSAGTSSRSQSMLQLTGTVDIEVEDDNSPSPVVPRGKPVGLFPFVSEELLASLEEERSQSTIRSEDEKRKKRRSSYVPNKREPSTAPIVDKDEHIRQLEKRLADLMLKNREVKTLRSELSEQRRKYKDLEEQYHQNRLMWLIATGVNPGENMKVLQASSACAAAARGDVKTLEIMLEHDADIHQSDYDHRSSLHLSAANGHTDCVKFLIDSGAPLHSHDRYGKRPLEDAVHFNYPHIAQMIEEAETIEAKKTLDINFLHSTFLPQNNERKFSIELSVLKHMGGSDKSMPSVVKSAMNAAHNAPATNNPWDLPHIRKLLGEVENAPPQALSSGMAKDDLNGSLRIPHNNSNSKIPVRQSRRVLNPLKKIFGKTKKDDGEESSEEETTDGNSKVPNVPFGIAFGILRGACHVPGCTCDAYKPSALSGCTCGHFPASHKNLGQADLIEGSKRKTIVEEPAEEEISNEPLIKKSRDQTTEFPQVLNLKVAPYTGELAQIAKVMLQDQPEWVVDSSEIEFHSELGKGTAAKVYKGTFIRQVVAIKMMEFRLGGKDTEKLIKDLEHEFDIMTKVHSQYVVNLMGVVVEPRICMIVEFCAKGSLFHVLQKADFAFTWPLLFKWYKETVEGIKYLHNFEFQIVHRDIKSLNLLVTESNSIKVADFGLSRFTQSENSTSTLAKLRGTYCYTAPEVYFGQPYTVKSDVYSLGILLWELVYRLIFQRYSTPYSEFKTITMDFQIIIQAAKKETRPTIPPPCPEVISQMVNILWRPKPEDRPDAQILEDMVIRAEQSYLKSQEAWDAVIEKLPAPGAASPEILEKKIPLRPAASVNMMAMLRQRQQLQAGHAPSDPTAPNRANSLGPAAAPSPNLDHGDAHRNHVAPTGSLSVSTPSPMPSAAPLIAPALKTAATEQGTEDKKMVTKLSSEFVQSTAVSSAPVVADFLVGDRQFRVTSAPFNPNVVPFDDLLKAHDTCSFLLVAFELASSSFVTDFTTWLNASQNKGAMQTVLLANRAVDAPPKESAELSSWATSSSLKLFDVVPKTGDGTKAVFDGIIGTVDVANSSKSRKEHRRSHRTVKSDMGVSSNATTPEKKIEKLTKRTEKDEDESSGPKSPKGDRPQRDKLSQSRSKLTVESSDEHEQKRTERKDRERKDSEKDGDKKSKKK